ncbi:hypothetical protein N7471_010456 [Penicillium samsonianum]|uniref:uncharacterized protein n=1 Tax=Penicillium samsonianum TaxID=1882272 RepID=UPI002547ECC2|nr:uncharacterized protein N7471_010456 [Penicillium samsonianum]KAJ6125963.1 hypothetical protein N7471_010456 [Penicillium samsonianum]
MLLAGLRIPSLIHATTINRGPPLHNLLPLSEFEIPAYRASGLAFFPSSTLQQWESPLKKKAKFGEHGAVHSGELEGDYELDGFSLDIGDAILEPMLNEPEVIPTLADQKSYVQDSSTPTYLTLLVTKSMPLNAKQRLVVKKVLSEALDWANHPYDASKRHQTLLYVGGEGGVEQGHYEIVGHLLGYGADNNGPPVTTSGRTALQAAAEHGHVEKVNFCSKAMQLWILRLLTSTAERQRHFK